jgi:hypothetical protein
MNKNARRANVLLVPTEPGSETTMYRRFMPALVSLDCVIQQLPEDGSAMKYVEQNRFDLIVVGFPLERPDMPALLKSIRWRKSACRRAAVLLVTDRISKGRAEQFLNRGVNRVIVDDATDWELESSLGLLLKVEPRFSFALTVKLEIPLGGKTERVMAQIDNVSTTGMLVRGQWMVELGAPVRFEFMLPEQRHPVRGLAEVVRSTVREREGIAGFGLHFVRFDGDSGKRLDSWLNGRPDSLQDVVDDVAYDSGAEAG